MATGFTIDEDTTDFARSSLPHVGLAQLHAAWCTTRDRRGGRLPAWTDLDAVDFASCLPHLVLLSVLDEGADYRYDIHGIEVTRAIGADMTGRLVSDHPPATATAFIRLYRSVLIEPRARLLRIVGHASTCSDEWVWLVVPLAGDGVTVDRLLAGAHPSPPHDLSVLGASGSSASSSSLARMLQRVFDHAPFMFNLKDRQGRYIAANQRFAAARDTTPAGVVGRTAHSFFPRERALSFESIERHVFETGEEHEVQAQFPSVLGGFRHNRILRFPVRDVDGEVAAVGMIALDTSEQHRVAEELDRARRQIAELVEAHSSELAVAQRDLLRSERLASLGELMATVSHELRTPLGTVVSSVVMLRAQLEAADRAGITRTLDRIERNAHRCARITGELLDFARDRPLRREMTDIDRWLAELLAEAEIPSHVELSQDLSSEAVLDVDRELLRQALLNVVENGCQAMEGDGPATLRVSAGSSAQRVEIVVTDSGPGISGDVLERIFEPLYSTKTSGIGLGLPLVRRILEQHGGGVEVGNMPGAGARITLWIPASDQGP